MNVSRPLRARGRVACMVNVRYIERGEAPATRDLFGAD